MTKKDKKRAMLYLCVTILFAAGIVGICFYKSETAKKQAEEIKKNMVSTIDDLPGKKIGVQIGTTGEAYSADYEKDVSNQGILCGQ